MQISNSAPLKSCYDTTEPDGMLRKVGNEWVVNWLDNAYRFHEDDKGYIYAGIFTSKNGAYNGYAQFNPTTKDIFATEGYLRDGVRLTGPRADAIIAHARATIFSAVASGGVQPSCQDPAAPEGKLRKSGDEWLVDWVSNTYRFREDPKGYIYAGFFTGKNGGYNGYVHYNPTTKDMFATDGYLDGPHLSGARAKALMEHAVATLFQP